MARPSCPGTSGTTTAADVAPKPLIEPSHIARAHQAALRAPAPNRSPQPGAHSPSPQSKRRPRIWQIRIDVTCRHTPLHAVICQIRIDSVTCRYRFVSTLPGERDAHRGLFPAPPPRVYPGQAGNPLRQRQPRVRPTAGLHQRGHVPSGLNVGTAAHPRHGAWTALPAGPFGYKLDPERLHGVGGAQ